MEIGWGVDVEGPGDEGRVVVAEYCNNPDSVDSMSIFGRLSTVPGQFVQTARTVVDAGVLT